MSQANILVAEDFPAFRDFLQRELRQRPDLRVVAVGDGLAAVEQAERLHPEIVLLDIGLPKLDGLAAAQRIRAISPESNIVFVSQESAPDVIDKAIGLGSRGFIQKTRALHVLPVVDAILDGRHATHRCHQAQFCDDDAAWLESGERYLSSALNSNDAAIAVATPPRLQPLVERMRKGGIDVDRLVQKGTFVQLDANELAAALRSDGVARCKPALAQIVESAAAATLRPQPRVAIFSELAPILWTAGDTELAIELEQFAVELVAMSAEIVCAYPMLLTEDARGFTSVCAHHGAIVIR